MEKGHLERKLSNPKYGAFQHVQYETQYEIGRNRIHAHLRIGGCTNFLACALKCTEYDCSLSVKQRAMLFNEEAPSHDGAQICLNGHVINDAVHWSPELR